MVSNQHFMGIASPPAEPKLLSGYRLSTVFTNGKGELDVPKCWGGGQKHPGESWKAKLRSRQLALITGCECGGENGHA